MPFTPTHILAVLPVAALFRRLPPSSLVIGSMIPDLPLFLPFAPPYGLTHSLPGLLIACLPAGLIAFALFHYLLKAPLIALLPEALQSRLRGNAHSRPPHSVGFWLTACLSIVIGALTHIVWDAFTHEGRWGVGLFPILQQNVLILGRTYTGYKLVQYGSTLVGLPLLCLLTSLQLYRKPIDQGTDNALLSPGAKRFILLGLVTVVLGTALITLLIPSGAVNPRIGKAITNSGLALLLYLVVYSVFIQISRLRQTRATPP